MLEGEEDRLLLDGNYAVAERAAPPAPELLHSGAPVAAGQIEITPREDTKAAQLPFLAKAQTSIGRHKVSWLRTPTARPLP